MADPLETDLSGPGAGPGGPGDAAVAEQYRLALLVHATLPVGASAHVGSALGVHADGPPPTAGFRLAMLDGLAARLGADAARAARVEAARALATRPAQSRIQPVPAAIAELAARGHLLPCLTP